MTTIIKLQSSCGEVFDVPIEIAKRSLMVKTETEILGKETFDSIITLPNVRAATLKKAIEFATHHKDDPTDVKEDDAPEMTAWDQEFFNIPSGELTDLIKAAEDLEMRDLLVYSCRELARNISGKSIPELKDYFGC